jgi:tetratricopeptide (TPR) repeat protein
VTPDDTAKLNEALSALSKNKSRADILAADLVARYPDEPRVRLAYAAARSLMQDYASAVRHLDIAAALADSALIQFNLGYCHRQCGDYERAAFHFRKSLSMPGSDHTGARVLAANTFDIIGRPDEAKRLLTAAPETPLVVFARWLIARDAERERARAYVTADPARFDEAVLFWMKYDCHLFSELDDKARLARLMNGAAAKGGAIRKFWPETFAVPGDTLPGKGETWWLFKPSSLSGGQGMRFTRDPSALNATLPGIVQQYLHPPFLLLGRKFNLRLFLCINSIDPLEMYLWHDGLVFVSTEPYAEPDISVSDAPNVRHVVNLLRANEKDTSKPLGPFPAHIMSRRALLASGQLGKGGAERMEAGILALASAIKDALIASGFAERLKAFPNPHAFPPRFVGLDVGFDEQLTPRLFEIERYPGLGSGEGAQRSEINTRFRRQWPLFALSEEPEKDQHFQRV